MCEYRNARRGEWLRLLDGLDPETTSLEQAVGLALARFAAAQDGRSSWVLVTVDFHQQHRDDPAVAARHAELYEGWTSEIRRFVEGLRDGGWLAPDVDADLLARRLFAYGDGVRVHADLYGIGADDERRMCVGLLALLEPARVAAAR